MVEAPRLVSSDASPTRPEWAVTYSTPAARAAAWNRRPTIFGESGTTRSSAGFAKAPSIRIARATLPFTNRTSFVSPSWFVFPRRTVTNTPSPAKRAHLAPAHPPHEEEPGDHGVEAAALEGDLLGLTAAAAPAGLVAGGEDGVEVRRPERPRLPPAAIAGGPPVAGEDPGRPFSGRARVAVEAGPEARRGHSRRSEARRGHSRRGARRRPALVVEFGEVGGEGYVLKRATIEPGVEAAERPGVRPVGVRAEGGLGELAGGPHRSPVNRRSEVKRAHLAPAHPSHEEEPGDHGVEAAAVTAIGPPVAGEDPGRPFPGRARVAVEVDPEARRGHSRRGARRRPALVVEFGEVGGEGCVLERATIEPGVEAAERPGVRPVSVRAEGGLGELAGGPRQALKRGSAGVGESTHRSPVNRRVAIVQATTIAARRRIVQVLRPLLLVVFTKTIRVVVVLRTAPPSTLHC